MDKPLHSMLQPAFGKIWEARLKIYIKQCLISLYGELNTANKELHTYLLVSGKI